MHKQKPDLFRMLKFYILRNVHMTKGLPGRIKFNFSVQSKLIPNSSLIKAFQYAIFGFTYPRSHPNSKQKPPCPFTPYSDDEEFKKAIKEFYPITGTGASELEEVSIFDFKITEEQFHALFSFSNDLNQFSYIVRKLKYSKEEEEERKRIEL